MYKIIPILLLALALAAGCDSGPKKPDAQTALETKLKAIVKVYDQGDNAAQRDDYRKQAAGMRDSLFAELAGCPHFDGWICKVASVNKSNFAKLNNQEALRLELNCGPFGFDNPGGTIDMTAGAEPAPQVIMKGQPLYDAAIKLKERDIVKVSGSFLIKEGGKISESSLSTAGSIRHPDFGVIYRSVEPAKSDKK